MVGKEQIESWLRDGTITQEQAKKMLSDTIQYKEEQISNKLITTISTIGALLLGIGAILFVASNWVVIPRVIKILLLLGSTFVSHYLGYIFRYQKENLPKAGAALLFLGALLFGATIFLIAQMYNINANSHTLVLIWLIGIIPLVYALKSLPIAGLSAFLFYLWVGLFVCRNVGFEKSFGDIFYLPVLYLITGILLFGAGGLHYISGDLKAVARTYRIAGIKVVTLTLFLLTFRFFSGHQEGFNIRSITQISEQFMAGLIIFSFLSVIFAVVNLIFNPANSDTAILEGSISIGLLITAIIFFFSRPPSNFFTILFNLILAGVIFILILVGYQREDIKLINIGMSYLASLIIVRYFDFFWNLLPRSVFFMSGGLILILGGIAFEKKRRQLKERFRV
ncbi:MAG: DUF2157 domain-containing protein [Candidatus Omnitrophota bacterium]|nr:DUF2157 domain-containing protein [Candidatus Omnitrophota bacterium]